MAHLGRLGQGVFALGVLVLVQPAPGVGAASAAGAAPVVAPVVGPVADPSPLALGQASAQRGTAARQLATPARAATPDHPHPLGRAASSSRTALPGKQPPPAARLPVPAGNRAYGLPVALAIVAAGGVVSLLVRLLLAEGDRGRVAGRGPDRAAD